MADQMMDLTAEEWINDLEGRVVESIQMEQQKEKINLKNEMLRDPCKNFKKNNTCIMGSQKEKREWGRILTWRING